MVYPNTFYTSFLLLIFAYGFIIQIAFWGWPSVRMNISDGRIEVNLTNIDMATLQARLHGLRDGGWEPGNCNSRYRVAILVPYRDRAEHLRVFLRHIHPFLQRQLLDYRIYVIEQTNTLEFNRGFLFNVGVIEALKHEKYDCFIFHDVDLLPEDDRIPYSCPRSPILLSSARSNSGYKMPYKSFFGGVTAMSREDYIKINGYSNLFFGWGGEDDEVHIRILSKNLKDDHLDLKYGRYRTLRHQKAKPAANRWNILDKNVHAISKEGLNTTTYKILEIQTVPLFSRILTEPLLPGNN